MKAVQLLQKGLDIHTCLLALAQLPGMEGYRTRSVLVNAGFAVRSLVEYHIAYQGELPPNVERSAMMTMERLQRLHQEAMIMAEECRKSRTNMM